MPPKRVQSTSNALSPQNTLSPNPPPSPNAYRSTSPSGFTQFLAKPTKWFTRSVSASKVPSSPVESRPSFSSSSRKPKISKPTDPRPILDTYSSSPSSKSVLDLSSRHQGSIDLPRYPQPPSTPSSPTIPSSINTNGLGDLRNISKRAWSKSADDLNKISAPIPFSPMKASFQDRVAEYRARTDSGASAVSSSNACSSSPVHGGRHPFPSLAGSPPSSSPPIALRNGPAPRSSTLPPLSVSVSTPVLEDNNSGKNLTPTHVHTRSHSFTPKLPSKLAGTPTYPSSPRLPPSASSSNTPMNHRSTTLLSPPAIIEPQPEKKSDPDPRRSSQILVHSGLINKLTDVPPNLNSPNANLQLSKGWKPYKMELKGSKLYFFKPPSDRNNAIKDLFPTGLVPPSEEEDDEPILEVEKPKDEPPPSAGGAGRRKRAFWGRRTHPDLVSDDRGEIVKGTFEALVHEAAFGTTFDLAGDQTRWKDFASSILLALPNVIDRATFETELLRCCSYLISGAEDDTREAERTRVGWIANEYLRHHGKPVDGTAWDEWKKETIPGVDISAESTNSSSGMPTSASTQAIYPSSPPNPASPEFTTFSPRPDNAASRMIPLLDALNPGLHRTYEHPSVVSPTSQIPWNVLQEEGLTRDILVQLDPLFLARSLTLFHRSVLEQSPENLTAEFLLPDSDHAKQSPSIPLAMFFGTEDQPHWLTKLLLVQIFSTDTHGPNPGYTSPIIPHQTPQQLQSPGRRSEDRSRQPAPPPSSTSRTHTRSEIISVWAKVGELCRRTGDECSWRAIAAALCSRPVARLDKAWRRVEPQALGIVESWSYPSSDGKVLTVNDPQVTPWGGDLKTQLAAELGKAKGDSGADQMMTVSAFHSTKALFEKFRAAFVLCPRNIVVPEEEVNDDVRRMVSFWKDVAEGGRTSGLAIKFQRPDGSVQFFVRRRRFAKDVEKHISEVFPTRFWPWPNFDPPEAKIY